MDKEKYETVEEISYYPCVEIPERGLSKETCEKWGLRTRYSEVDNTKPIAHYMEVTKKGVLSGYIKRDLTKPKKKAWSVIGIVNVETDLLGQSLCSTNGGRKLFCVEGMYDGPSLWQALWKEQKVSQQYSPNVVSIPLGTVNAAECIGNNLDFVGRYAEFITVFDNDKANAEDKRKKILLGQDAVEEVARLCPDLKNVCLELNDPNDYLVPNGEQRRLMFEVLTQAKPFEPDDFVEGSIDPDELYTPLVEGVYIKTLPRLSNILHGFRKGEATFILAPAGVGKTTAITEMAFPLLLETEYKVDLIYAEEDIKKAQQRYIAMYNNIPLNKFRQNPAQIPFEKREEARYAMIANGRSAWLDTKAAFGKLDPERLLKRLAWSAAKGYDYVWIDHLTMMIYGKNSDVSTIDDLLVGIAEHVTSTGQGVIGVSHITRRNRLPPKDRDGNIVYPYWMEVQKEDARGCVDKDTEFLSQDGWKKISEYGQGDFVLQHNDKGEVEFVKPEAYIKLPCESMYHIKHGYGLDMVLSEEHNIVYTTEKKPDVYHKIIVKDALDIHDKQATGFRGRIPCTFKRKQGIKVLNEQHLRIQIMFNADGWIKNPNTGLCAVRVKKQRKIDRVRELLKDYKHSEYAGGVGYREFSFIAPMSWKKGFSSWWYAFDQETLEIIADEVLHWDCDIATGRFTSISKEDADFIQYVYSCTGNRSVISDVAGGEFFKGYQTKPSYVASKSKTSSCISFRKCLNSKVSIEKFVPEDGYKYCFTVPSGMFVVRRNGKIFVTGNSGAYEQVGWNIICIEPEILENKERGRIRFRVDKNREHGILGLADVVKMDKYTGRLVPADDVVD